MNFKPCQPYHAVFVDKMLLKMPDDKSAFKIYFISLIGRAEPHRYEWPPDKASRLRFVNRLQAMNIAGVGFVTAFMHITKVFRFAPAAETVLDVRAFKTPDLAALDLQREEGYCEFACYAEAFVAADEYRFWAKAKTVEEYLESFCSFENGAVVSNTKLAAHFGR